VEILGAARSTCLLSQKTGIREQPNCQLHGIGRGVRYWGPPRSQCCAGLKCKNDRPGLRAGGMGHCVKPEDDTDEGVAKTSQESGGGHGCRWGCHWDWLCRCCKCHKDSEEQTNPNGPKKCQYPPCSTDVTGEPTETSQESGGGHSCRRGCHWDWGCRCCKCHKDSEEQTNPNGEKLSVQKLVSAGLDLLKAGKKLKFNVDVKNPEALLGDKQSQGQNWLCCLEHLPCCHKKQD